MRTQKNNSPRNWKGYDKSETTDEKLSARRFQIFLCQVFIIIFWPPIFQNMQKQGPNTLDTERIKFASSNVLVSRSQILLRCLGLRMRYMLKMIKCHHSVINILRTVCLEWTIFLVIRVLIGMFLESDVKISFCSNMSVELSILITLCQFEISKIGLKKQQLAKIIYI